MTLCILNNFDRDNIIDSILGKDVISIWIKE